MHEEKQKGTEQRPIGCRQVQIRESAARFTAVRVESRRAPSMWTRRRFCSIVQPKNVMEMCAFTQVFEEDINLPFSAKQSSEKNSDQSTHEKWNQKAVKSDWIKKSETCLFMQLCKIPTSVFLQGNENTSIPWWIGDRYLWSLFLLLLRLQLKQSDNVGMPFGDESVQLSLESRVGAPVPVHLRSFREGCRLPRPLGIRLWISTHP